MTDQAGQLTETLADIEALAHRVSWELLDESQRDDFIRRVVVPRWGATTADGVVMKGTAWAGLLGTTEGTIKHRVSRLRVADQRKPAPARRPSKSQRSQIRGARSAIRQHPELAAELIDDPEVAEAVQQATPAARIGQAQSSGGTDLARTLLMAHTGLRDFRREFAHYSGGEHARLLVALRDLRDQADAAIADVERCTDADVVRLRGA